MTSGDWARLEALFHAAISLPAEDRRALLERECGGNTELRAGLERLLTAHDRAGGFIQAPAASVSSAWDLRDEGNVGRRIGAYRLVRELGRGGMGAVYLAERNDGAFAQRVAIKLIKRGMDTDHVLARFRAERQILASLDHPNIARLLDGGSTDLGLPYFAMEYIDGQPIDAYADARRLGVDDRLRLFLRVCDAVAYAHGQGVVHRDIKPLNILVTAAGVPKLLDFGIAKVLQDDSDEVTSTVTGLRLLTPDYASPEQVEGRHATAASDVYSLGVVLYELLTGRSPYRLTSRSPQEVAAAVCTTEPDRPSVAVTRPGDGTERARRSSPFGQTAAARATGARQLRQRLRGDLDAIILSALRKEPGRRHASVAALADDLRRHLDGHPVLARGERVGYRAGKFLRRHRFAIASATFTLAGAAAVAAAGVVLSRGGAGDVPSLVATRALAPRDRILVADFANRAGDTTLAAAVTEAFRVDLSQSPLVRVLTPRQVRTRLETMQRPPDLALDDSVAREVALREGVKAFVTGSLAKLSGAYTVTAQLVSARSGEALAGVRETAADSSGLIDAIERASRALRGRIGEPLRALRATPALERGVTTSLPALRRYTEAQRLARAGLRSLAIERYREAIALDTGFASAYSALAMAYDAMGDPGRTEAAKQHALANQQRLPFFERAFLVASDAYSRQDYPTAIEAYTRLLERFPDYVPAINNLALAYRDSRQLERAESLFRHATTLDSTIAPLYFGIQSVQMMRSDFAGSRATLDLLARRFPDHPVRISIEMQDAAAQQHWAAAERQARAQLAATATDTLQLVDPVEALAGLAMTQGRLREADSLWTRQLVLARAAGMYARYLFGIRQRAFLELRYRSGPVRALALVDSGRAAPPPDSVLAGNHLYYEFARLYAAAGRTERARALLDSAAAEDREVHRESRSERSWTRGVLAMAAGRTEEGLAELERAASTHLCAMCVLPDLGRAYESAGRPAEAVAAYERYLTTPWYWRYEPDAVELGWTMQRLGELYERAGDRKNAVRIYARLVELWRRADPELAPRVADIRRRLEEVS